MTTTLAPRQTGIRLPSLIAMTAAYVLIGWLSLKLAIPPGYATPLYPPAGLALAAVLTWGRRAVPWMGLGGAIVALFGATRGDITMASYVAPIVVGIGAGLQALTGAWLTRRFVRQPLTLAEPRDIGLFFLLGAFASCTVSATIGTASVVVAGLTPVASLPFTWLTWWLGDSMGVLVVAPVVLTLIGQPRAEWADRRLNVGVTLALATLLVAFMVLLVSRWNDERIDNNFQREALAATSTIRFRLVEPFQALEALHSVFTSQDEVTRDQMRRASQAWFAAPMGPLAAGWAPRVPRAALPDFVHGVQQAGLPAYRLASGDTPSAGDEAFPVLYLEGAESDVDRLGFDMASRATTAAALRRAVASNGATATQATSAGNVKNGEGARMTLFRAVRAGMPANGADRLADVRGVVFVTIDLAATLKRAVDDLPEYLQVCIVDPDAAPTQRHLFGPPGCDTRASARSQTRTLMFGGRAFDLRITAAADSSLRVNGIDAWLFAIIGLLGAATLGALLLTVTGRTRRISVAVAERTAALEQQVRERELAQTALRESEQRFRNVFNTVPLGLVYVSMQGQIQQANPRFCELVGYSFEQLQRMVAPELTHPDDQAEDIELSRRLVDGEITLYTRQKRYIDQSGNIVWARTVVTALRDDAGRALNLVSVVEDITEHLRFADAERAREAAELSNRAKSEFLSRMSHELRTPLNAMLGFAQLLELDQRHPIADAQRPWVAQIQQAGWHLLDMINDVLDLSRIEAGTLRLVIEALELPTLLHSTLPLVQAASDQRRITITQQLDTDARFIRGDVTRVKQILTNLLSNAVKYNNDGGRIHVSSMRHGDFVEIAVSDTGMGMTPSQMGELFEPFNRLGRERSQLEGTGIGLVIAQRLAQLMGGSLTAESAEGRGSTFLLALPALTEDDTIRSELDELPTIPPDYHRRAVHYVEDNETNVEVMRGILAQRPQVRMDVSITGLDGLASIRAHRPDLILLDMHLPDISGMELLRHLKEDPATAGIPVVIVSADAVETQIATALQAGADRYLTKPVSVNELLGVLDELLDRAETRFG